MSVEGFVCRCETPQPMPPYGVATGMAESGILTKAQADSLAKQHGPLPCAKCGMLIDPKGRL